MHFKSRAVALRSSLRLVLKGEETQNYEIACNN